MHGGGSSDARHLCALLCVLLTCGSAALGDICNASAGRYDVVSLGFLAGYGQVAVRVSGSPATIGISMCSRMTFGACGSAYLVVDFASSSSSSSVCAATVLDMPLSAAEYFPGVSKEGRAVLNGSIVIAFGSSTNASVSAVLGIYCDSSMPSSSGRPSVGATPFNDSYRYVNTSSGHVTFFLFLMSNSVCVGYAEPPAGSASASSSSTSTMTHGTAVGATLCLVGVLWAFGLIWYWRWQSMREQLSTTLRGYYQISSTVQ
jgi:hypothetical protein